LPSAGRAAPTASAEKNYWDFVHALRELAIWLQAGEDRAIAAGSQADLKRAVVAYGAGAGGPVR
jgi:hypothetical protein